MAPPLIYLIRHGQTIFEQDGKFGGDSGLTDLGREQSQLMAERLKDFNLDSIYCSELQAGRECAAIIAAGQSAMNFQSVSALNEIDYGLLTGLTREDCRTAWPDFFPKYADDRFTRNFPGGENYQELANRLSPFLDSVIFPDKRILIIGQLAVHRVIQRILFNLEPEVASQLTIDYYGIYQITLTEPRDLAIYSSQSNRVRAL